MKSSTLWWVARGLLGLHAAFASVGWFKLPDLIPSHFGLNGQPDAWNAPSLFTWFMLPGISLAVHGLLQLLMLPGAIDLWNMPEKGRFLQLTLEERKPAIELMRLIGAVIAGGVTLAMLALHVGVYMVAQNHSLILPWYIRAGQFVPIACILISLVPWSRAMRRAILQARPA